MSNPEYPWFPFFARDWLCDGRVAAMPYDVQGVYVRLLCLQWENGDLSDSADAFAALVKIPPPEFGSRFWPPLRPMFPVVSKGKRANKKLRRIRIETVKHSASISAKRSRASLVRWNSVVDANSGFACDSLNQKTSERHDLASNCNATCSDADADADADEEDEEKRVDAKPPTPSPPVSNPLPPGPPTADDGRPIHDPPRMRWGEFVARWNELAAAEDLPKIGGALSDARKRKARAVMASMSRRGLKWFEVLASAVRDRRGTWARGTRFPTLDQALREEIVDKLAEGFYERDRQASSGQPEHLNRQSDFNPTKKESWTIIKPGDRR